MKMFEAVIKKSVLVVLVCLITGVFTTTAYAQQQKHYYGDLGKPADYDKTIKDLKKFPRYKAIMPVLPASFNWQALGKVTPAKDQGSCGSCWAFASVGVLESRLLIDANVEYDLSEQQQVSCNTDMSGCSGGRSSALKFWYNTGPMKESCTSYCACDNPCTDYIKCGLLDYHTADYYTVHVSDSVAVKTSLKADGPAYFRFDVYDDFKTFWSTATPGAVYTQTTGAEVGGHAVLLIGWNDDKGAWLCKNSWGRTSGPNKDGTFWMAYTGHAHNLHFGMANITNLNLANIQKISCVNNGGFVMNFKVAYIDAGGVERTSTTGSGDYPINQWKTIDLSNLDPAIDEGTVVWSKVNAKAGKTLPGDTRFRYKSNNQTVTYMAKGTTQSYSVTDSGETVVNPSVPSPPPKPAGAVSKQKTAASLKKVQKISCGNNAGFVMYFKIAYTDSEGKEQVSTTSSGKYPIDQWRTIDLSNLDPPIAEGTVVWPRVKAILGKTKAPSTYVIYKKNNQTATYGVRGTTLSFSVKETGESVVNPPAEKAKKAKKK